MAADSVTVPQGRKVNVVAPTPNPHVTFIPSGTLIVDYGKAGDWRQVNTRIDALLKERDALAVVILQSAMIDLLDRSSETDAFFSYWKAVKIAGHNAVWVLPSEAGLKLDTIGLIHGAGFGVHGSAPDGACFVEVHQHGSITVGMPGKAL